MLTSIAESLLLALSLCADCFAVSTCSSVTLDKISFKKVLPIALAFGFIQMGLMAFGWMFGGIFAERIAAAAKVIGFLLLLYVGGSMILEAVKNEAEVRDLNGIKNVVIGAVATSIDAFAVGVSLSMGFVPPVKMAINLTAVFLVTMLSVICGMFGGQKIGARFGRPAEITGGVVLILIGLNILFEFV
jgi:putative Mn2+ efflux pump MntP